MTSASDLTVLRGDQEIVVEEPTGDRYVYTEVPDSDGDYKWDHEASDQVQYFPSPRVERAVEEEINGDVVDHFPLTVTVHANAEQNTREMCRAAGLPYSEDALIDTLWYYPGEFSITYTIAEDSHQEFSLTAEKIEYDGKTFTPE